VIDEHGKNLGVLPRADALKLVRDGVDLIEIAPTARPPVARLMSFDKYRYELEKQRKKEREAQRVASLKHIQISARAAMNDLLVKLRQAEKFLKEGHQIEIQLRLRGREKQNKAWARGKLDEFMKMITTEYKLLCEPRFGGRGMNVQIIKK